jgi:amidase
MHYGSLGDTAGLIRRRQLSPVTLTRALLERLTALEPRLHSYASVHADSALAEASAAEAEIARGQWRGPLHGMPVAVKDLIWTRQGRPGCGMRLPPDGRPGFDATVVRRLRRAGAVILGTLEMTEGAFISHHPAVTPPVNPWHAGLWTGVSSSGSGVATAAGLCFASLGTDTGGSIRFPSAACGLTGLKPTWGRVSRHGLFPMSPTLDHIGPMARSAEDAAHMLAVLAGHDPDDPSTSEAPVPDYAGQLAGGLHGLRLGIDSRLSTTSLDAEVAAALEALASVLTELGARRMEVRLPDAAGVMAHAQAFMAADMAAAHAGSFPAQAEHYGAPLRATLEQGRAASGLDVVRFVEARADFAGRMASLFETVDMLLLPVMPGGPLPLSMPEFPWGGPDDGRFYLSSFTMPFDITGHPSLTLPAGLSSNGGPIGLQLVGRPFAEDMLLRAGHGVQRLTDWHTRRPPDFP